MQILIKDLANERRKVVASPSPATDKIFFAGTSGRLLLRLDDRLLLFETQSRRILSELQVQRVKYVHWSPNNAFVALISKHGEYFSQDRETMRNRHHNCVARTRSALQHK
mmetsp:Transcript_10085/g.32914  ORF Transcript_10085/g.32914 Transcript_10085/m.32914 type:complete len:110 (+) Transcript_10085:1527-1856(+)